MNSPNPLSDLEKRTRRYWYVDGLVEMVTGLFLWVLAAFFAITARLTSETARAWVLGIGQPALILLGIWLSGRVVVQLKERITYPRTGYIAYRRPTRGRRITRAITGLLAGGLVGFSMGLLFNLFPQDWTPAIASLFFSLLMAYLGWYFGVLRFYLLALFLLAGGLAVTFWVPFELASASMFFLFGLGLLVSGAVTLRSYLASTRPVEAENGSL